MGKRPSCPADPEPGVHSACQTPKPGAHSTRQTPKPDAHSARRTLILHARLEPDAPARPRTMGAIVASKAAAMPRKRPQWRGSGGTTGIWAKKVDIFGNNWYRGGCKPCPPLWSEGGRRPTPLDAGGTHITYENTRMQEPLRNIEAPKNPVQERSLWERIIDVNCPPVQHVPSPKTDTEILAEAWQLVGSHLSEAMFIVKNGPSREYQGKP